MHVGPSDQYPTNDMVGTTLQHIGIDFELTDSTDANIDILRSCIGADCWGLYVRKRSGEIIPLMNTYRLYPEKCFFIRNKRQYEREQKYRSRVISNIHILLDELTEIGDSANVLMFEEDHAWMIECVRGDNDDDYVFNVYARPSLLQRI